MKVEVGAVHGIVEGSELSICLHNYLCSSNPPIFCAIVSELHQPGVMLTSSHKHQKSQGRVGVNSQSGTITVLSVSNSKRLSPPSFKDSGDGQVIGHLSNLLFQLPCQEVLAATAQVSSQSKTEEEVNINGRTQSWDAVYHVYYLEGSWNIAMTISMHL
jgi:hypothetical protein